MEINKSSQNKSGIKDYLTKQFYLIKSELLTLRQIKLSSYSCYHLLISIISQMQFFSKNYAHIHKRS